MELHAISGISLDTRSKIFLFKSFFWFFWNEKLLIPVFFKLKNLYGKGNYFYIYIFSTRLRYDDTQSSYIGKKRHVQAISSDQLAVVKCIT